MVILNQASLTGRWLSHSVAPGLQSTDVEHKADISNVTTGVGFLLRMKTTGP